MKKRILMFVILLLMYCDYPELNAQSGGAWPPVDQPTQEELDCIASKHLGSPNTSDRELKSVKSGYAGYDVKYNKVKSAIRVFGVETTVILRSNLSLNAMYPDTLDTRWITQSPVLNFTEQNAEGRLLTTRPDIAGVE